MGQERHASASVYTGVRDIPYRTLGRTGEKVSIIGLGGHHIGVQATEKESIRIIRTAIDSGINFLDNSWDYNGGRSGIRMGKALKNGYRQRTFLMTKVDGRTQESFNRQLDESLKRLQTDTIDLLQFHDVIRVSDADRTFAEGGAIEAALKARQAGKIRYIGFTGHKSPDTHLKMLQTAFDHGFTFDTVQMPLNVMDAQFNSFQRRVLPVLLQHNIGAIGMKPMGDSIILNSQTVSATECLHYAMSLPVSTVVTGCDSLSILEQALNAARTFQPLTEAQDADLMLRTGKAAEGGKYEHYKTQTVFDSTSQNPQWLG